MSVVLIDDVRFRSAMLVGVLPHCTDADRRIVAAVHPTWRRWLRQWLDQPTRVPYRMASEEEIGTVVSRLRALSGPWCARTENYVCTTLRQVPSVPQDPRCTRMDPVLMQPDFHRQPLEHLIQNLSRAYHRAVLPPKTNIGPRADVTVR